MIASRVNVGDVMLICRVTSLNPYIRTENCVIVTAVETFKGRVRLFYGKTSRTCYPTEDIILN